MQIYAVGVYLTYHTEIVQTFDDGDKARELADKLKSYGYKTFILSKRKGY